MSLRSNGRGQKAPPLAPFAHSFTASRGHNRNLITFNVALCSAGRRVARAPCAGSGHAAALLSKLRRPHARHTERWGDCSTRSERAVRYPRHSGVGTEFFRLPVEVRLLRAWGILAKKGRANALVYATAKLCARNDKTGNSTFPFVFRFSFFNEALFTLILAVGLMSNDRHTALFFTHEPGRSNVRGCDGAKRNNCSCHQNFPLHRNLLVSHL